ncbi:branched-chain amino acid aminotransferase [Lacticaseibacillus mingshuiensis]|uniref:Branched-chain-amino-acid aminotransferase n=1 Tax=Lacticaseibacillus mingshuiensis TaxID=2799574 RepID=A0ABW4CJ86_9LACO|nr:branched-chain amino acid aminotransferase [Lacticaseibacillus mingshuiensis]
MSVNINWNNLGFDYMNLPYRYRATWKNGAWEAGQLTQDNQITMSEGSPILHYGQGAFEGLKAYRTQSGAIQLFRPDQNAKRMQQSAEKLLMPAVPTEMFLDAVQQVVAANNEYVPPYGTGATLYVRPLLIGIGDNIGVNPAPEYLFTVFAMPVGPYFKGGMVPTRFVVADTFDRAAHYGTGQAKVGGNYAASLQAGKFAHENGFGDAIYLDPLAHRYIEEVGSANFFAITKDGTQLQTPKSPSILPSITKYSILALAKERFNLTPVETQIDIHDLDTFSEAGACGTAAVITPIQSITFEGHEHVFGDGTTGPLTQRLYNELTGIQFGDVTAPTGWVVPVEY